MSKNAAMSNIFNVVQNHIFKRIIKEENLLDINILDSSKAKEINPNLQQSGQKCS